jgi:hypothetical protein
MAGDWIKMTHALRSAPEVVRISSACDADRLRTVGALYVLWCIADLHADDEGGLDGYTPEAVDAEVGIDGFARAVADAGWLEVGDKYLRLPNFHRHNGRSAKRRAEDARRKMSAREADKDRTFCGQNADQRREEEEEEERREDIGARSVFGAAPPEGVAGLLNGEKPFSMTEAVKAIYAKYPRKVGKRAALAAIENAIKRAAKEYGVPQRRAAGVIFKRTTAFAKTPKGTHPSECPHPSTFFNQDRFDDDPATWQVLNSDGPDANSKLSPEALEALYAE